MLVAPQLEHDGAGCLDAYADHREDSYLMVVPLHYVHG